MRLAFNLQYFFRVALCTAPFDAAAKASANEPDVECTHNVHALDSRKIIDIADPNLVTTFTSSK